jgi:UDP-MurNAc hydroxylase
VAGTDFKITILESDYAESAAYDSSIVIEAPGFTVFNNNDCFLHPKKYDWVRERHRVDYAFLGFSPASFYPSCFEFEPEERKRLLQEASERRYEDFLAVARALNPSCAIPFAMGIRFLHESMSIHNEQFNAPQEAVRRVRKLGIHGEVLWPGDRVLESGTIERRAPALYQSAAAAALKHHMARRRKELDAIWAAEAPAAADVVPRFREYLRALWESSKDQFPEVRENIIAYRIQGPHGGAFHLDFSKPDIVREGDPARFDMRYTYPDKILQLRLDGKIDWDELHFSNRVSVCQNRYADKYYAMLRSEVGAKPTSRG